MAYRPRDRIWQAAAATVPVVSLADLKSHCRIDHDEDDLLLPTYEAAAVSSVEAWTQRLLTPRAVTLRMSDLPCSLTSIELPGGAVSTLTSVIADGVTLTGATVVGHSPALLIPATDWPIVTGTGYPVTITYTAGYATVPPGLVHAVMMLAGHFYENREAVVLGVTATAMPLAVEHLMMPHRIWAA